MTRTALITLLTALLLVPITSVAEGKKARAAQECANADLDATKDNLPEIRTAILCLHNKVRAEHGLPALRENTRLRKAALGHSKDMVKDRFFEHTTPKGATMVDRILRSKYVRDDDGWALGENLAWGTGSFGTPRGAVDNWMKSPGHRANLLRRSYRDVGIGVVIGVPVSDGHRRHLHGRFRRPAVGLPKCAANLVAHMADVRPFRALHYDRDRVGGLQPVVAPPYDVIDAEQRAALVARSPHNVVEIDLPQGADPYAHAAEVFDAWRRDGILVRDDEDALWALEQDYTGPDGRPAHPPRLLRARGGRGLRARPHPPARAHASRPEGGPAAAHARHPREPLPHLLALRRPGRGGVGRARAAPAGRAVGRGDRRGRHRAPAVARRRPRGGRRRSARRWPTPSC